MVIIDLSSWPYQVIKRKWRTPEYVFAYPRASLASGAIIAFCHVPFEMVRFAPCFTPGIPSASYCFTRGQSSSILWQKGTWTSERASGEGRGYFRLSPTGKMFSTIWSTYSPFFSPSYTCLFLSIISSRYFSFHPPVPRSAQTSSLPPRIHYFSIIR